MLRLEQLCRDDCARSGAARPDGSARFWIQTGRDRGRRDELTRRLAWAAQGIALLDRELAD